MNVVISGLEKSNLLSRLFRRDSQMRDHEAYTRDPSLADEAVERHAEGIRNRSKRDGYGPVGFPSVDHETGERLLPATHAQMMHFGLNPYDPKNKETVERLLKPHVTGALPVNNPFEYDDRNSSEIMNPDIDSEFHPRVGMARQALRQYIDTYQQKLHQDDLLNRDQNDTGAEQYDSWKHQKLMASLNNIQAPYLNKVYGIRPDQIADVENRNNPFTSKWRENTRQRGELLRPSSNETGSDQLLRGSNASVSTTPTSHLVIPSTDQSSSSPTGQDNSYPDLEKYNTKMNEASPIQSIRRSLSVVVNLKKGTFHDFWGYTPSEPKIRPEEMIDRYANHPNSMIMAPHELPEEDRVYMLPDGRIVGNHPQARDHFDPAQRAFPSWQEDAHDNFVKYTGSIPIAKSGDTFYATPRSEPTRSQYGAMESIRRSIPSSSIYFDKNPHGAPGIGGDDAFTHAGDNLQVMRGHYNALRNAAQAKNIPPPDQYTPNIKTSIKIPEPSVRTRKAMSVIVKLQKAVGPPIDPAHKEAIESGLKKYFKFIKPEKMQNQCSTFLLSNGKMIGSGPHMHMHHSGMAHMAMSPLVDQELDPNSDDTTNELMKRTGAHTIWRDGNGVGIRGMHPMTPEQRKSLSLLEAYSPNHFLGEVIDPEKSTDEDDYGEEEPEPFSSHDDYQQALLNLHGLSDAAPRPPMANMIEANGTNPRAEADKAFAKYVLNRVRSRKDPNITRAEKQYWKEYQKALVKAVDATEAEYLENKLKERTFPYEPHEVTADDHAWVLRDGSIYGQRKSEGHQPSHSSMVSPIIHSHLGIDHEDDSKRVGDPTREFIARTGATRIGSNHYDPQGGLDVEGMHPLTPEAYQSIGAISKHRPTFAMSALHPTDKNTNLHADNLQDFSRNLNTLSNGHQPGLRGNSNFVSSDRSPSYSRNRSLASLMSRPTSMSRSSGITAAQSNYFRSMPVIVVLNKTTDDSLSKAINRTAPNLTKTGIVDATTLKMQSRDQLLAAVVAKAQAHSTSRRKSKAKLAKERLMIKSVPITVTSMGKHDHYKTADPEIAKIAKHAGAWGMHSEKDDDGLNRHHVHTAKPKTTLLSMIEQLRPEHDVQVVRKKSAENGNAEGYAIVAVHRASGTTHWISAPARHKSHNVFERKAQVAKAVDFNKGMNSEFMPEGTTFDSSSLEHALKHPRYNPEFSGNPDEYPGMVNFRLHPANTDGMKTYLNRRGEKVHYDPEMADYVGQDADNPYNPMHTRLKPDSGYSEEFPEQSNDPGHLYRGMGHDEYHNALKNGYFQSDGRYNMEGEEGHTLFALNPRTAMSYATGFAPMGYEPTFGKNGYVIKIKQPDNIENYDYTSNYKGVKGQIPLSSMVSAWEARPHTIEPADGSMRQVAASGKPYHYEQSNRGGANVDYGYKQVYPPDKIKKAGKRGKLKLVILLKADYNINQRSLFPDIVPHGRQDNNPSVINNIKPDQRMLDEHDNNNSALISRHARMSGFTPTEYKAKVGKHFGDLLKDAQIAKRVRISDLPAIIKSGRLKTQHETNSSQGMLDPFVRAQAEQDMFSIPNKYEADGSRFKTEDPDPSQQKLDVEPRVSAVFPERYYVSHSGRSVYIDPHSRQIHTGRTDPNFDIHQHPIYGYYRNPAENPAEGDHFGVTAYGDVAMVMKPHVKDRSTFTVGDSLHAGLVPSRPSDPKYNSAHYGIDPLEQRHVNNQYDYIEAQMHGGVNLNDVDYLHFTGQGPDKQLKDALARRRLWWKSDGTANHPTESFVSPYDTHPLMDDEQYQEPHYRKLINAIDRSNNPHEYTHEELEPVEPDEDWFL